MKVLVRRDQADVKGWFGGHKGMSFSLQVKAEPTTEERDLIHRYKLEESILHEWQTQVPGMEEPLDHVMTVKDLLNGRNFAGRRVTEIIAIEEGVIKGAQNLKLLIDVASSFGGERVIEI